MTQYDRVVERPEVKAFHLIYLDPQRVQFERRGDTLSMTYTTADGLERYPRVALRSCFPVSEMGHFLSVRDAADEQQPEIGIVEDWTALREADRAALAAELNMHYFVPRILKVHAIKEEFGFLYWTVETDKGAKQFVMSNNIVRKTREIGPEHWLLIDVNQARYEIADVQALDRPSKKLIKQFLYL